MNFLEILKKIDSGNLQITTDSRKVSAGSIFFAVRGSKIDGHSFINSALKSGAAYVISEIKNSDPRVVIVQDTRKAWAEASGAFFHYPENQLKIIGVTGTNGKTTTTWLIEALLSSLNVSCALIGTIENRLGKELFDQTHTTPDAFELHKLFQKFLSTGARAVSMEVSSHALDQERVHSVPFSAVVFTNLTQDHLDYHGSFEKYFTAKAKLFLNSKPEQKRIIFGDDPYGAKLVKLCKENGLPVVTYGAHPNSDYCFASVYCTRTGIKGELVTKTGLTVKVECSLLGAFNIQNVVAAIAVLLELGYSKNAVEGALKNLKPVPGRMELISRPDGKNVVVDYAHTPDALEKVLQALQPLCDGRLICLFGCGGDRDQGKRPKMAAIAEELADEIWITSDNPRSEDPLTIIETIKKGLRNPSRAHIESDRAKAISAAVASIQEKDILLIAGKGHETYQIIGNKKILFDDREMARRA